MNALQFSDRVWSLPLIHGSGDFAIEVRRTMLAGQFDCLAVPLPPSFQEHVERGIAFLPSVSFVLQREPSGVDIQEWSDSEEGNENEELELPRQVASYVPIDPCQGVIAGLRFAIEERLPRAFIDLETAQFET